MPTLSARDPVIAILVSATTVVMSACLSLAASPPTGLPMFRAGSPAGGQVNVEIIVFEGRLVEMPSDAPRCGDDKVAVAFRFAVQRVVKGAFADGEAIVLVPCPDLMGERFFQAGGEYLVDASSDMSAAGSYTIYNDYEGRRLLWATGVTRR